VGVVLRAIQERVGFVGKIIVGLLGVAGPSRPTSWCRCSQPRKIGPIEAIKESATLLRKTWGENLIGQAGLGLAFGLIFFAVVVFCFVLFGVAIATGSVSSVIVTAACVVAIIAIGMTALIQAALGGIYAARSIATRPRATRRPASRRTRSSWVRAEVTGGWRRGRQSRISRSPLCDVAGNV
jgi:hypothetical protein